MGRSERRARGSSPDASQIEFLDAGGAWGNDWTAASRTHPAATVATWTNEMPDEPGSRRATTATVVVLACLIGVGVVAASPWDEPAAAPPVVTNAAPPVVTNAVTDAVRTISTAPTSRSTSSAPFSDVGASSSMTHGYLIAPGARRADLRSLGMLAPTNDPADSTADDGRHGWLELWATPGASRTNGSWFAVQYGPMPQVFGEQDGARIVIDDRRIGIYRSTTDGVHTLTFPTGRSQAEITWFGWDDSAVVQMAAGLRFSRSGHPQFADDGFAGDHARLMSRSSYGQGLDRDLTMTGVISSALYTTGTIDAGGGGAITVTTSRADPELDLLAAFVLSPAPAVEPPWQMANGDIPLQGLMLFPDTSSPPHLHLVQQTDASGVTVRITTGLTFAQLAAVLPASQLVRGTVDEWSAAQSSMPGYSASRGDTDVAVADGTFNGVRWDITVTPGRNWANVFLTWPNLDAAVIQLDLGIRPCGNLAGKQGTLVVCVRHTDEHDAIAYLSNDTSSFEMLFQTTAEHPEWHYVITLLPGTGSFHSTVVAGTETVAWDVGPGLPT